MSSGTLHIVDAVTFGTPSDGQIARLHSLTVQTESSFPTTLSIQMRPDASIPLRQLLGSAFTGRLDRGLSEFHWAQTYFKDLSPDALNVGFGTTLGLEAFFRQAVYRNLAPADFGSNPLGRFHLDLDTLVRASLLLRADTSPFKPFLAQATPEALRSQLLHGVDHTRENAAYAVLNLLTKVKRTQPELVQRAIAYSYPSAIGELLGLEGGRVVEWTDLAPIFAVHASIPNRRRGGCLFPLASDTNYSHIIYCVDLEADISGLLTFKKKSYGSFLRSPSNPGGPLVRLSLARVPYVVAFKELSGTCLNAMNIDAASVAENAEKLLGRPDIGRRLREQPILNQPMVSAEVESMISAGPFPAVDRAILSELLTAPFTEWHQYQDRFSDRRIPLLAERIVYRECHPGLESTPMHWISRVDSLARQGLDSVASKYSKREFEQLIGSHPSSIALIDIFKRAAKVYQYAV